MASLFTGNHGVFVDDFATIPTSQRLKEEFETLYAKDFGVTGGGPMTTFLGLEVEQSDEGISLHVYPGQVLYPGTRGGISTHP